jgi:PhnB protein
VPESRLGKRPILTQLSEGSRDACCEPRPLWVRRHRAIVVDAAADAIAFYKRALSAVELFRRAASDGTIVHAEIRIGTSVIMVGDAGGPFRAPRSLGGSTVGLHLYVDDVDALFAQAIDAGATAVQDVQDVFYGDRAGMVQDPYGHIWVLLTHQEDLSTEEIERRAAAALGQ